MKTSRSAALLVGATTLALLAPAASSPAAAATPAVEAPAAATAPATTATTPAYVARAWWVRTTSGLRLRVAPSTYGRKYTDTYPRTGWDEAVRKAGGTRGLSSSQLQSTYNQFRCHAHLAPQKDTWNSESWRPNVGYVETLRAGCNP